MHCRALRNGIHACFLLVLTGQNLGQRSAICLLELSLCICFKSKSRVSSAGTWCCSWPRMVLSSSEVVCSSCRGDRRWFAAYSSSVSLGLLTLCFSSQDDADNCLSCSSSCWMHFSCCWRLVLVCPGREWSVWVRSKGNSKGLWVSFQVSTAWWLWVV